MMDRVEERLRAMAESPRRELPLHVWPIDLLAKDITRSDRRVVGPLITLAKRVLRPIVKTPLNYLFERQAKVNHQLSQAVAQLENRVNRISQESVEAIRGVGTQSEVRQSDLEGKLSAFQDRSDSQMNATRQRLGEFESANKAIQLLLKAAGERIENLEKVEEANKPLSPEATDTLAHLVETGEVLDEKVGSLQSAMSDVVDHLREFGLWFRMTGRTSNGLTPFSDTETVGCLMCGDAEEWTVLSEGLGLAVRRCSSCGFTYASPRIAEQKLSEFYSVEYWTDVQRQHGYPDYLERFAFDYNHAASRLSRILRYQTSGTLIDIGCGNGALVRRAAEWGYDALGYEVSPAMAAASARLCGRPVLTGEYGTLPDDLNVITLFDVFEHLYHPLEALRVLKAKLTKGGVILIETFRIDGAVDVSQLEDYKPGEHVYYYREADHRILFHQAGLAVREKAYPLGVNNSRVLYVLTGGGE